MLNVMIVDDEEIIRKGLSTTFNWESVGCRIVSEASDTAEAIISLTKTPLTL